MKVLLVITKSNWGGAQRYVYDLACGLSKAGHDVSVAFGSHGPLATKLTEAGIRTHSIEALGRDVSARKDIVAAKALYDVVHSEKPDVLHLNSSKIGGIGALIGRMLRVPRIVFTSHGWAFNEDRPWWQRILIKKLSYITVLLTHVTIVVSEVTRDQLNWPGVRSKMRVVYNGRKIPEFMDRESAREKIEQVADSQSVQKDGFWTLSIGELHPVKQHEVMIDVVAGLKRTLPKLQHFIIGEEGEHRDVLEKMIEQKGLKDRVFLLGSIPEAATLLRAADIYVHPSRSEALPYVIIEACQAGVPIIASRVGGIPEIVTHEESALLVEPGSTHALKEALMRCIHDTGLREKIAKNAQKEAERFRPEVMIKDTVAVYENSDKGRN